MTGAGRTTVTLWQLPASCGSRTGDLFVMGGAGLEPATSCL
jgi:hypothetical protein